MVSQIAPPPIVHSSAGRRHVGVIVQVQGAREEVWLLGGQVTANSLCCFIRIARSSRVVNSSTENERRERIYYATNFSHI